MSRCEQESPGQLLAILGFYGVILLALNSNVWLRTYDTTDSWFVLASLREAEKAINLHHSLVLKSQIIQGTLAHLAWVSETWVY